MVFFVRKSHADIHILKVRSNEEIKKKNKKNENVEKG
jgi:hypothetical protein